ncbi:hypothetical protein B296_00040688 [Ensete ventricosum]|uniref:Uncharacterized protein n=1 Tax=Ensete ventricosum TaxID=4639 RepID=A0A426XF63_ENSVE|nr:hypothetical protein B296_00040688 [Ensete ventricosum]
MKAIQALEVMKVAYDYDSIVTKSLLERLRSWYCISDEYELHAPRLGQHPYSPFLNGLGLTYDALEAGLKLPLHSVIERGKREEKKEKRGRRPRHALLHLCFWQRKRRMCSELGEKKGRRGEEEKGKKRKKGALQLEEKKKKKREKRGKKKKERG